MMAGQYNVKVKMWYSERCDGVLHPEPRQDIPEERHQRPVMGFWSPGKLPNSQWDEQFAIFTNTKTDTFGPINVICRAVQGRLYCYVEGRNLDF